MPVVLTVIGLGLVMMIGLIVLIVMLLCRPEKDEEPNMEAGFGALSKNPEFANAIQKSFANQANMVARTVQEREKYVFECLTCNLIQMGENMAYSDNTCPHCGTTMDREIDRSRDSY